MMFAVVHLTNTQTYKPNAKNRIDYVIAPALLAEVKMCSFIFTRRRLTT